MTRIAAVTVLCALALASGGCVAGLPIGSGGSATTAGATTSENSETASAQSTPSAQSTASAESTPSASPLAEPTASPSLSAKKAPAVPRPSAKSRAYSSSIGGVSHKGERLYFIVGDSVGTEREAQALLTKAIPSFGDMQSFFIVQRSDNFDGMRAGWWVVIEAHLHNPKAEDLQFAKRGFPGAYVKRATVRTSDPIPVYDQLVPQ